MHFVDPVGEMRLRVSRATVLLVVPKKTVAFESPRGGSNVQL